MLVLSLWYPGKRIRQISDSRIFLTTNIKNVIYHIIIWLIVKDLLSLVLQIREMSCIARSAVTHLLSKLIIVTIVIIGMKLQIRQINCQRERRDPALEQKTLSCKNLLSCVIQFVKTTKHFRIHFLTLTVLWPSTTVRAFYLWQLIYNLQFLFCSWTTNTEYSCRSLSVYHWAARKGLRRAVSNNDRQKRCDHHNHLFSGSASSVAIDLFHHPHQKAELVISW